MIYLIISYGDNEHDFTVHDEWKSAVTFYKNRLQEIEDLEEIGTVELWSYDLSSGKKARISYAVDSELVGPMPKV